MTQDQFMAAKFPNFQAANHARLEELAAKLEEIGGGAKNNKYMKVGLRLLSERFADAVGSVVVMTAYGQGNTPDDCAKAVLAADVVLEEFTLYTRDLFEVENARRLAKFNGELVD